MKKIKEYPIAYQTVDPENDIWCNRALLFKDKVAALNFFAKKENVFEALGFELLEGETMDDVEYEVIKFSGDIGILPSQVIITCKDGGKTDIREMSRGIVIK